MAKEFNILTDSESSDSVRQAPQRFRKVKLAVLAVLLFAIGVLVRPSWHIFWAHQKDLSDRKPVPAGFTDDASAMNQTSIAEVWTIPSEPQKAEDQLVKLLQRAQADNLKVSIAGARHSMGGHTIAPNGIVVNMLPFNRMTYAPESQLLNVQAGAIWHDVIEYLDGFGRSVSIMQSNDSFSVGGSISVNCHGWQFGKPPIASAVDSFRLMLADGTVVLCSREENQDLFGLALGGYGLFGIILDVNLHTVPNRRYKVERYIVPAVDALATFDNEVLKRNDVEMVYARMDVSEEDFLNEALIYVLAHDPTDHGDLPDLKEKGLVGLRRSIFRGSIDSEYGKRLRWKAETELQPSVSPTHYSRNQVLSEGVETFANRSEQTTDILHEYFLPRDGVPGFVVDLQRIIPQYKNDLLNVTIRSVETDTDTFLRYADQRMFSFVMLFNHARTESADDEMQEMTRQLISAALNKNGRYYLPYRLHATQEQFDQAYPQGKDFFELKRKYDPHELFINAFYLTYGRN